MTYSHDRGTRRLTLERLEARELLSVGDLDMADLGRLWPVSDCSQVGIPFQITVDPQLRADFPSLEGSLAAAGEILGGLLGGDGCIEVSVVASGSTAFGTAEAGSDWVAPETWDPNSTAPHRMTPCTLYESLTGIDINQEKPDIVIEVSPDYLKQSWFDPSGSARTAAIPADKHDFVSTALHELLHGLGMEGFRRLSGPEAGQLINNQQGTFDALTDWSSDSLGLLCFHGASAVAAYGGPVPLTSHPGGSSLAGTNFYHLGSPSAGKDLYGDLMSGMGRSSGARYDVSAVDRAILTDLGWQPPRLVPNRAVHEKPWLEVDPPIGPILPIHTFDLRITSPELRYQQAVDATIRQCDDWRFWQPTSDSMFGGIRLGR